MTPPKRTRPKSSRKATQRFTTIHHVEPASGSNLRREAALVKLLQAGLSCHQAQQFGCAIDFYQQVLDLDPQNSEALHLLGVLALQQGQAETAVDLIRTAIQLQPNVANYHLNLGCALQALQGQVDCAEAIGCFETALHLDDTLILALNSLANARCKQGRVAEAADCFQRGLKIEPNNLQLLNNYASLLIETGDLDQAKSMLLKILKIEPELAESTCNLALIEARNGSTARALELYRQGLKRQPSLSFAWNNLAHLLAEQGAIAEAEAAFEQVAKLIPKKFRQLKASTVCPVIVQSIEQMMGYRASLEQQLAQTQQGDLEIGPREWEASALVPPFYLPYHGLNDLQLKTGWARLFQNYFPGRDLPRRSGQPNAGFVVADRHVPVFWKFVGGFLQHLPSSEIQISIIGSNHSLRQLTKYPIPTAVKRLTIPHRLVLAAEIIAKECFDVIYFFEPDADAFNYFLAFHSLAPVQCTSWGIPVTSGIPAMTDFISSQHIEPNDAQRHYSEKLVTLSQLPVYFHRPAEPAISTNPREFFDFKKQDRLYGCPHSLFKFHPDFDRVLAAILRQDEKAKLVMVEGRHAHWSNLLRQRWSQDLPDVADRIHILPQQSHNDFKVLLQACDVLLDPFPFGGGATTYEAMLVGKPTVTVPGQFMRGRVTLGCWKQMGINDCIASDTQDYVSKAIEIANEPDLQQLLKQKILAANQALLEDQQAVSELRQWLLQRISDERNR